MNTAIATIENQSAFAKQNMSMGDLFAKRLQDLFNENLGAISITAFGSEECQWSKATKENISFKMPDGRSVTCLVTTPKEGK